MDGLIVSDLGLDLAPPTTGPVDASTKREAEEDARKAIHEVVAEEADFDSVAHDDPDRDNASGLPTSGLKQLRPISVQLPPSTLIFPRSVCDGFVPPAERVRERQALEILMRADPSQAGEDFIQFELANFSCYVDTHSYDSEMRALHSHATLTGKQTFYLDGILRAGAVECFVQRVPFEEIPLGNYGKAEHTVGDQMWIRSSHNNRRQVYYQLKRPSLEYARYHEKFVWVADLAKHVHDFCEYLLGQGRRVFIHSFKHEFSTWLQATHGKHLDFQRWYAKRGADDFRQSIVANSPYIRKEICSLFSIKKKQRILIFRETSSPFSAIPVQGALPSNGEYPKTIVTPYIYSCFAHMESGAILKPIEPTISNEERIGASWPQKQSREAAYIQQGLSGTAQEVVERIQPGHVISTFPDEEESGTMWKTKKTDKKWYGLVQKVGVSKRGVRRFDVTWLYQPEDTPCCSMKYPWDNELFLSNHCTCAESAKVREDQILGVHSVEWHGSPGTAAEFFIRQTYLSDERRFVTLQEAAHRRCSHGGHAKASPGYKPGDTVLAKLPQSDYLEPCELIGYLDNASRVRLRVFKRRSELGSGCPPNELVYTQEELCCKASAVVTRCIIRCYSPTESVPVPYNQRGVGNAFYVTHRQLDDGRLQPWGAPGDEKNPSFRQGFDPTQDVKKLRALDLFSGFGNFGRGLEDGGAIEAKWANDIWDVAAHTYKFNSRDPQAMNPFLGSVDELLRLGMEGEFSSSVPRPDEVDVILGGSPCQGFSLITIDKDTDKQRKNRSMVASFASAVDFWRPQWGILENVRSIVKSSKDVTEDCFSQLICALVGMGYQTQIILGDAWSYGAPQSRVRVFLCFAAPGLRLPQPPYPSHSNPRDKASGRLGKMTNGLPYVEREDRLTAFKYVTASEATADLPDIHDSNPDTCLAFPDHRLSVGITTGRGKYGRRKQIRNVPIGPYGVNFAKAYYGGDIFAHEAQAFPLGTLRTSLISKSYGRQHPHQLFSTITTTCLWTDARTGGGLLHWRQPRPLTVMEVRRAQGVPDGEVLCGTPRDQWKLVGNAVARQVSVALGLKLREAWVGGGGLYEEDGSAHVPAAGEEKAAVVPPMEASSSLSANPNPDARTTTTTIVQEEQQQQEQESEREVYIVIDDDDDDNDDDDDDGNKEDVMSLGEITSQADAGPSSSTRATSFVEVQEELGGGRETTIATSVTTTTTAAGPIATTGSDDGGGGPSGVLVDGKKRLLSSTELGTVAAAAPARPLSPRSSPSSSSAASPTKKQRVVIEISSDDDDDDDGC